MDEADRAAFVALGGQTLELLGERALHWPAQRRLIVADLHLGKADAFRSAGLALPEGDTREDLDRLARLVVRCGVESLWVLGDFLHGPLRGDAWRDQWRAFRRSHSSLDVVVVPGNHDRALRGAELDVRIEASRLTDGPFVFAHDPAGQTTRASATAPTVVCGHVHPVVRIPGIAGRHPAFVIDAGVLVLPAFSAFTGGWLVTPDSLRFACVRGHLLRMPPQVKRDRR